MIRINDIPDDIFLSLKLMYPTMRTDGFMTRIASNSNKDFLKHCVVLDGQPYAFVRRMASTRLLSTLDPTVYGLYSEKEHFWILAGNIPKAGYYHSWASGYKIIFE